MNLQARQVAERIRELREIEEVPAADVAKKLGISEESYLQYENAQVEIPISVLYTVAGYLGVDPTVLLSGDSPRMNTYTIVRGGKGMSVERYPEYSFTSLAFNFINREMEPMIVDLKPKDAPPELVTHGGQEFNYVLEGKVCVLFGGHRFVLEAGDSIYFDPRTPHGQMAVDGPAKFITIINDYAV